MSVYMAHAGKDARVAQSLEKFLKQQAVPVKRSTGDMQEKFASQADALIMVWSRHLRSSGPIAQLADRLLADSEILRKLIVVTTDGEALPDQIRNAQVVDASSAGLRQNRAWRQVVTLTKNVMRGRSPVGEGARIVEAEVLAETLRARASSPVGVARISGSGRSEGEKLQPLSAYAVMFILMLALGVGAYVLSAQMLTRAG